MKEEIIIAGHGGQGVVLAGNLIANIAMECGLETCAMFSYGVEMRGGVVNSTVIISDNKIGSPVVVNSTTAIIMSESSLEKFEEKVKKNGLIILNTSECKKKVSRKDVKVIEIEATKLAEEIGNNKAANVLLVGAYIKSRNLRISSSLNIIKKILPRAKEEIIELNKKALDKGYNLKGD